MSEQPIKSDTNKVVQLNPERSNAAVAQPPIVLTRMPAAMHNLRDKARMQLQLFMQELFEKVDDALFSRADKATSNQDQNLYFDSMREVRIRRRSVEAAFFRNLDIKFAQLFDANAYASEGAKSDAQVSVDSLSLVKNDELEELVAIESVVNKANEQFAELLQHLAMRIDHLVPIKVYQQNNPVGPNAICDAFIDASRGLDIDVKARLVLYKLFDNLLTDKMGELLESLNGILIDSNILVSLKREGQAKRPPAPPAGASAQSFGNQVYDEQTNQVLSTLRNLLGTHSRREARPSTGEELATGELLRLLSLAQHQQRQELSQEASAPNLRALLSELLQTPGGSSAINQVDDDVINLVSMMFEFILDDRNLAAPMKALIGRLQIPLVKVAIADKSFFSKGGHPARRLLNEMAMACLGWQESSDPNKRDNLYEKMQEMVSSVNADFDTDLGVFDRLLVEFRSFLDKEKRRAQILEQRTLDAEDGKAKSERARLLVEREMLRITGGRELPDTASKLLREAWSNVMFITCLKEGTESQQWQDQSLTARQLVWSLLAPMEKENRQKLLKLVPELMQKLRTGLESIAFSPFETAQLFKQLEVLHLTRLRGGAIPANSANTPAGDGAPVDALASTEAARAASAPVAPGAAKFGAASVATGSATASEHAVTPAESGEQAAAQPDSEPSAAVAEEARAAEPLQPDSQHLALVGNITQGTWFEMMGEGGERYRCRLAAIIRSVGKYIFVNRSGMKVAEETRDSLALALQTKRLQILDDGMLFDRALESVITNLREKRSSN